MFYEDSWDYREFNMYHRILTLMYFAFTTLSTVGFGDYYPVSAQEKLVGAFVMLFGVAAFSYCAGELCVMVENLQEIMQDDFQDKDDIEKFFQALQFVGGGNSTAE